MKQSEAVDVITTTMSMMLMTAENQIENISLIQDGETIEGNAAIQIFIEANKPIAEEIVISLVNAGLIFDPEGE